MSETITSRGKGDENAAVNGFGDGVNDKSEHRGGGSDSGTRRHAPTRRAWMVPLAVIAALAVVLAGGYWYLHHDDAAWLPCKDLHSYEQVSERVNSHPQFERELRLIDGSVSVRAVRPSERNCPSSDKGYVLVTYANPFARKRLVERVMQLDFKAYTTFRLSW